MNASPWYKAASRMSAIAMSDIVKISEAVSEMKRQGENVIGLGTGEPDFDTPDNVLFAASKAMHLGETRYTPTAGTQELKAAICKAVERDNDLLIKPNQIIVSNGAKQVLFNAFLATLNPDDEVIIPTPYWSSYIDMVSLCGGKPITIRCNSDNQFKLTAGDLAKAITPKTRWVLLNSPNNPSGATYSRKEMEEILNVLHFHPHVGLIADEIYQHLVYDDLEFLSALKIAPALADRILIVNGVSKTYSMTGWRIGYGIGPTALIDAMTTVQTQVTGGACSISQAAATAALSGPQFIVAERRKQFQFRRDLVVKALNQITGLECQNPEGSFYVFPSCAGLLNQPTKTGERILNDTEFCEYLIKKAGVAVVPGKAFGTPGYFRISYAYSTKDLSEACSRIASACAALF